jgi:hypothetical protein
MINIIWQWNVSQGDKWELNHNIDVRHQQLKKWFIGLDKLIEWEFNFEE